MSARQPGVAEQSDADDRLRSARGSDLQGSYTKYARKVTN